MKTKIVNTAKSLLILVIGMSASATTAYFYKGYTVKQELIDSGYAQYNSKTGNFEMMPMEDIANHQIIMESAQVLAQNKKRK